MIEIQGTPPQAPAAPAPSLFSSAQFMGGLVGGGLSLLGGVLGNRSAAKAARQQQQWQEHMRATQYQTAVADLKAAGLNPMLAYTQGGAGTPSGGQAQTRDVVSPAVASAAATAAATANIENIRADTLNKVATASQISAQTRLIESDEVLKKALARLTTHQGTSAWWKSRYDEDTFPASVKRTIAESLISQHGVPKAESEADLYRTLGAGLSGAKSLTDMVPLFKFLLRSK